MTTTVGHAAPVRVAMPDWSTGDRGRPGLERFLDLLDRAIDGARRLGLATAEAEQVRSDALGRLGFPADVFVLALVGGTGVGKSSLLNSLAGAPVSRASVRRPTTDHPVAWVPREARADLDGLLDWLGVGEIGEHDVAGLDGVAVLDLPDMDSVEADHRTRVEALLPRVDAVVWVMDPEKYHDAVLHDEFLRSSVATLATQAVLVNKADRLDRDGGEQIRHDVERDLRRMGPLPAGREVPVLLSSATGGAGGLIEVRRWLDLQTQAKRVVRGRLAATIVAAIDGLAAGAGVDRHLPAQPLLDGSTRREALDAVTLEVLRAIDLPGLERQAVAGTRARARARGTGPIGLLTSLAYRISGREARVADPGRFVTGWRDRAGLGPAVEALRDGLAVAVRTAPPAIRPLVAASVAPEPLRGGLETAVDRVVRHHDMTIPTSRLWTVLGGLQLLTTAALVLSALWVVLSIVLGTPSSTIQVPILGLVPTPLVVLGGALVVGYVVARLLGLHAGLVGRRWARRLSASLREAVGTEIATRVLEPMDAIEAARRTLWSVARAAHEDARRT